jgi:CheY-like chemotaxis protein
VSFKALKEGLELLPTLQKVKDFKKSITKYFLLIILKAKSSKRCIISYNLYKRLREGQIQSSDILNVRQFYKVVAGRRSVLIVDDEVDIITSVKRWLQDDGLKVYGYADPLQALEYFKNNSGNIDLVLSDIRMSKMNGYELVKKIKTIQPETKVIFMTALETDRLETSKILPSIKIDGFMLKPGSLENLVNTVKEVI